MMKHVFSALLSLSGGLYLLYIVYLRYIDGFYLSTRDSIAIIIIAIIPLNEAYKSGIRIWNKNK